MSKLPRTKQCKKCPWKVSTDPFDIPYGYCETKHKNLESTIAKEPSIENISKPIHVMACHHSIEGDGMYCIGWLHNQLGIGNNIAMRITALSIENINDMEVYEKQHVRFEDTLPTTKSTKGE